MRNAHPTRLDELYRRTEGGVARDYLTDALGSVLALADETGQPV